MWQSTQVAAGFPVPLFGKEGLGEICRAYVAPFIELECLAGAKETSPRHNQIPLNPPFPKGESASLAIEASAATTVSSQQDVSDD